MIESFDLAAMEREGGNLPPIGTAEREAFDAEHMRIVAALLAVASPLPAHCYPASHPQYRVPEHCPCQHCQVARS